MTPSNPDATDRPSTDLPEGRHMSRLIIVEHPDGTETRHPLSIAEIGEATIRVYPFETELPGTIYHDVPLRITLPATFSFTS